MRTRTALIRPHPVYQPCSNGPDKVFINRVPNGHSVNDDSHFHLKIIETTRKYFLAFEVHEDESCAIKQDHLKHLAA